MSTEIEVINATPAHLPHFLGLMKCFAAERGEIDLYDESHARNHLIERLRNGMSFLALKDHEPIGTIMMKPVDAGFRLLTDMETEYIYIVERERSLRVVSALFDAAEKLADETGATLVLHQLDYLAASAGAESNGRRVEKLLRYRGYDGPSNLVYARQPYVHVGVTYLYQGLSAANRDEISIPGVRLVPDPKRAAGGEG